METIQMEKVKKLVPELRFKGFDEGWKLHKLGELGTFKNGLNKDSSEFGHGSPFVNLMDVFGKSILTESNFGLVNSNEKDKENYNLIKGDVLFIRSSVKRTGVGETILVANDVPNTVYSGFLIRFRDRNKELGLNFKSYCFSNAPFRKELLSYATSSANTNINQESLAQIKLYLPSLPEQQKIASFLSAVDEKIQQLTRKKELLEQYKKGVMQKIFAQELRFKDENGNDYPVWEQKRLDYMITKFVVPMRDKPTDLTGEIPWCRIEDFDGKYLGKSKSGQGVNRELIKSMNLKVYPIGTLLVSCSANLGFCAITQIELMTNQTFIGLVPNKEKVDVLFLLYVMRMLSRKLNTLSSGTTISYLSRQQFEQFKIPYPTLSEQTKIANFLSSIDAKIESASQQITQTQTFKKGLLQKMFVAA
jgi:type I restriction enzyme S subunit